MPYPKPSPLGVGLLGQQAMNVLYQHRLVSTQQLHRLLTPHHTRAEYLRRQLHQLRRADLAAAIGRRAHGQTDLLWWLTPDGADAVEATGLLPARPYRMNAQAAAGPLQEHTLATVEAGLAFVEWARTLGHECGPLDWTPEIAHYYRDDNRPGEDLSLVPDAVISYVHTDKNRRTLLNFFVEVDRTQMTIARLAQKLHAYAKFHQYIPQPSARSGNRSARRLGSTPAWRGRYPAYPRLLFVLTGASTARLERRIADLRSLAAADPALAQDASTVRAGATTLQQLRSLGPFAPIFTPVLGTTGETDAWLRPSVAAA